MVVTIDWRRAGVFYPTVGFFPFLWRIWHNVGRDTYSEHRTFILSLMRQAQGHEAVPKMLRESWHEGHPSFLLKSIYLHGLEQMDLQKSRCVSLCAHSGSEGDYSSIGTFQMQRWSSLCYGSCRARQAIWLQASSLPQHPLQDLDFFQSPWTAVYSILWGWMDLFNLL